MSEPNNGQTIGIWMTSALVVGTMIGAGIFLLPVSLAPLGLNAVIGWVISAAGALCIAVALCRLVRREGGGIQSYVEAIFGPTVGFIVTFAFWVSSWTAMAAVAIATAAAISRIVPALGDPLWITVVSVATTIVVAVVNARGVRAAGGFALLTVAIKILPLVAVIVLVAWRLLESEPLAPLTPIPVTLDNIATAVALTLFAMLGFEAATAPVAKVRDPDKTIPRAILAGTLFVALLYLFSSTSVSLILSPEATERSLAPYADALTTNWGEVAALLAALAIAISALGALNNNLLVAGELGYSMALRGDLPTSLARTSGANTPVRCQLVASAFTIVLVLLNSSKATADLFTFVVLLTTTANLVVYFMGGLAAFRIERSIAARVIIAVSIFFSLFAFYGVGAEANLWGLVLLIAGLAVRWMCCRLTLWRDESRQQAALR
jgi:APA family basic amino acid/polyamine antiporter